MVKLGSELKFIPNPFSSTEHRVGPFDKVVENKIRSNFGFWSFSKFGLEIVLNIAFSWRVKSGQMNFSFPVIFHRVGPTVAARANGARRAAVPPCPCVPRGQPPPAIPSRCHPICAHTVPKQRDCTSQHASGKVQGTRGWQAGRPIWHLSPSPITRRAFCRRAAE